MMSSEHTYLARRIAVSTGLELIGKKKRISHCFCFFKMSSTSSSNTDQCRSDHCHPQLDTLAFLLGRGRQRRMGVQSRAIVLSRGNPST